jgi:Fe2+ or Zn2+ uptake regulation protein
MRPLKIMQLQKDYGLDLIGACILDHVSQPKKVLNKKHIVGPLDIQGVSSPATTYKYLDQLERLGFITQGTDQRDTRATAVAITNKGLQYLTKWGK